MGNPEPLVARPLKAAFSFELEQLRLQIEVMALKVDEAIQHSTDVLLTGDLELAQQVVDADDGIDDMLVSLTERCYSLLTLQNPVASDLRLVVSVIRILADLERMGDLCLRVVNLAADQPLLASNEETFRILRRMAYEAQGLFRVAMQAWSTQDLKLAMTLEQRDDAMDAHNSSLMQAILALQGANAVPLAVKSATAGRAFERIADHSVMIGERLRYMLTGNVESLWNEVRPSRRPFYRP